MAKRVLTRPLRTLIVDPSGGRGGAQSWLLTMLDHTDRLDVEVILLTDGPLRSQLIERGIGVTVLPVGRRGIDVLRAALKLRKFLRRRNADVVVANGVKAAAVVCPAALLTGVRSVWVKHDHSFDRLLSRPLGKLASRVVATSRTVATAVARPDSVIIEPPRPASPLPPADAHRALVSAGITKPLGAPLLAMVGRVVPYKGIDSAILALALPGGTAWHLVVIGETEPQRADEKERLATLAAELGVTDRVHFISYVAQAGRLLSAVDAVAVLTRPEGPRTPGQEGFGIAALEAMTAGKPVIAIDDGGAVAQRVTATAGMLVPPGSRDITAAGLAAALAELTDPGKRSSVGEQGQRHAANHPDARTQADRFVGVLAETALRPGAGSTAGPPITVISPIRNEVDDIERLLRLVGEQLGPADEHIVADGGSTDGTVEIIQEWMRRDSRVRLILTPGGSCAINRNAAARQARHEYLICADASCDPDPDWLAAMRAAAAQSHGIGSHGPQHDESQEGFGLFQGVYRVRIRPGHLFEQAMAAVAWADPEELRRPRPSRQLYGKLLGRRFLARRVDGRLLGFQRDAWQKAAGFDEELVNAEDAAFGKKVLAAGVRAATTLDAVITMHQRRSVWATFRQFHGYGYGGGQSRSVMLLMRDGARIAAYSGGVALLVAGGWWGGGIVALGAVTYLSLPISRVLRRRHSAMTLLLLPLCAALKDAAKVLGSIQGLLTSRGQTLQPTAEQLGKAPELSAPPVGNSAP